MQISVIQSLFWWSSCECSNFSVVRLDAEMLKARGIKPGPLYARIKAGHEIEAPDGSVIKPQDVVGPTRQGRKIGNISVVLVLFHYQ